MRLDELHTWGPMVTDGQLRIVKYASQFVKDLNKSEARCKGHHFGNGLGSMGCWKHGPGMAPPMFLAFVLGTKVNTDGFVR